jgi:hypothetical protein
MDRPRFRLVLEAQAADIPAAVRLRVALKRLARCYGLRCLSAEAVEPPTAEPTAPPRGDPRGPGVPPG